MMDAGPDHSRESRQGEVEFFGIKLKVNNPRLATLLNSSVNEDVVVIGRRTVDLIARADDDEDVVGAEAGAAGPD